MTNDRRTARPRQLRSLLAGALALAFVLAAPLPALAAGAGSGDATTGIGHELPLWSVAPFALLLLSIAMLPLFAPHFWESNRNKAIVSLAFGVPVGAWIASSHQELIVHTLHEYAAFILLLGALYVISGGIVVRGSLDGAPALNTGILALGGLLASFIGTTGASMLLIRPLLRANAARQRKTHVVIFFIFIVSNIGGCLTPLGDPPLFLGFLRGVPFAWTFRLIGPWFVANVALLFLFLIIDSAVFHREDVARKEDLDSVVHEHAPLSVAGVVNFVLLAGVVVAVLVSGLLKQAGREVPYLQEGLMLGLALFSLVLTPRALRVENKFTYHPIIEVAVLFLGIFLAMVPPLEILNARGGELGLREPWHYFWATGMLSSFLDNAPTYLTFAATACGAVGADANHLGTLLEAPGGEALLIAVSLGAVFMGANTYIGNGPNFMVKAVAEEAGVKMPSFFGYMAWSIGILIPLFVGISLVFFR